MLFTDPIFLFYFLPLSLLLFRLALGKNRAAGYRDLPRLVLFLLTLVFYGWSAVWWLYPLFLSLFLDYLWVFLLVRAKKSAVRKGILCLSVIQNIGILFLFKYSASEFVQHHLKLYAGEAFAGLPAGISFYTFESLSFVIDVYRGEIKVPVGLSDFLSFICMYPRFIAGPIVRFQPMKEQFQRYSGMRLAEGLPVFFWGFFLKCCFADSFAVFAQMSLDHGTAPGFLAAWTGMLAYTMQLYFDFSGYSLMAIGLGKCFGFDFPQNFNRPYLAESLQDFWRRWHMTLSLWLRDYVYIPLGGNRKGPYRAALNVLITMVLGGIWHGSGWTFLIWGLWHGLWLSIEKAMGRHSRVFTLAVVFIGWVFFRAKDLNEIQAVLFALTHPALSSNALFLSAFSTHPASLALSILGIWYCFIWKEKKLEVGSDWIAFLGFLAGFFMSLGRIAIPFLYFRF